MRIILSIFISVTITSATWSRNDDTELSNVASPGHSDTSIDILEAQALEIEDNHSTALQVVGVKAGLTSEDVEAQALEIGENHSIVGVIAGLTSEEKSKELQRIKISIVPKSDATQIPHIEFIPKPQLRSAKSDQVLQLIRPSNGFLSIEQIQDVMAFIQSTTLDEIFIIQDTDAPGVAEKLEQVCQIYQALLTLVSSPKAQVKAAFNADLTDFQGLFLRDDESGHAKVPKSEFLQQILTHMLQPVSESSTTETKEPAMIKMAEMIELIMELIDLEGKECLCCLGPSDELRLREAMSTEWSREIKKLLWRRCESVQHHPDCINCKIQWLKVNCNRELKCHECTIKIELSKKELRLIKAFINAPDPDRKGTRQRFLLSLKIWATVIVLTFTIGIFIAFMTLIVIELNKGTQ